MKITVNDATLTLDVDPEDFSDDSLRDLITVAERRGLIAPGRNDFERNEDQQRIHTLQLCIERAFASLIGGKSEMATAQLAAHIDPEVQRKQIVGVITAEKHARRVAAGIVEPEGSVTPSHGRFQRPNGNTA